MYEKPGYPADKIGEWETITWSQYQARARSFAKALLGLGFEPFHGVCICGFNSPAWFIAHMGAMMAQGLSAGCYTTNSDELCQYVAGVWTCRRRVSKGCRWISADGIGLNPSSCLCAPCFA